MRVWRRCAGEDTAAVVLELTPVDDYGIVHSG